MKDEIILDRDAKDTKLLESINNLEASVNNSFQQTNNRITDLENANTATGTEIQALKDRFSDLEKNNQLLNKKLLDSVAHSRRLNLDFLGFKEEKDESVTVKVRNFWVTVLGIDRELADQILLRDIHRIGKYNKEAVHPRVIKAGFVLMEDRNSVMKLAHKCKSTDFAIRADLPPELVLIRRQHLDIRDMIKETNANALASCTLRSYRPVLIVKYDGKITEYKDTMDISKLEPGDRRTRTD